MRFLSKDDPSSKGSGPRSIQIIGAGLSRCATSSLQAAFESPTLDCGPCLHMARIVPYASRLQAMAAGMRSRTTLAGATNGADPQREQRHKLIRELHEGYAAVCDTPGWVFADDLMDIYPDAVIVLNGRPGGGVAWRKSVDDTIAFLSTWTYAITCFLWKTDRWMHRNALMIGRVSAERYGVSHKDPATYDEHAKWVKREAAKRGRKVVEWTPQDGWKPLCEALGRPVPEEPFPHVNDTKELRFILKVVVVRGLLTWAALGGAVWAGWRYGLPLLMERAPALMKVWGR